MAEAFIDTSFVIAPINQRDHAQAVELAAPFDNQSLITTGAVRLEIGNALARNFKAASIQIIEEFVTCDEGEVVPLNTQLFTPGFDLYRSPRQELGSG